MIKVLIITTANFENDGITNSILNYYRNMDKSLVSIDFAIPNELCDRLKNEIEGNGSKYYQLLNRNKKPIEYIKKLKSIIQEEKYDIVHAHGNSSTLFLEMYAAKLAKCKIRIAHSHNTTTRHPFLHFIFNPFFQRSYTNAFACGKDAGKWLFRNKSFTIINNCISLEKYRFSEKIRNEIRNKYDIGEKRVIGHVGRFNYQKNHEFLIDIFKELHQLNKNTVLVLIGDGNLKKAIEERVKAEELTNCVIFVGETNEVEKWLNAMDIMVFPSKFEGFPLVLVEWQASGLPCIISDTVTKDAKLTELVQFKSIDEKPKEWAYDIENIKKNDRNNPKYIKEIKAAGYDVKENAKKLEEIYLALNA